MATPTATVPCVATALPTPAPVDTPAPTVVEADLAAAPVAPGGDCFGVPPTALPFGLEPPPDGATWSYVSDVLTRTIVWDWHPEGGGREARTQDPGYERATGCVYFDGTFEVPIRRVSAGEPWTPPGDAPVRLARTPYSDGWMPAGEWFLIYYPGDETFGWKFRAGDRQTRYSVPATPAPPVCTPVPVVSPVGSKPTEGGQ